MVVVGFLHFYYGYRTFSNILYNILQYIYDYLTEFADLLRWAFRFCSNPSVIRHEHQEIWNASESISADMKRREPNGSRPAKQSRAKQLVFDVVLQLARTARMAQFRQGLGLDLANTLTGDAKLAANFLQRSRMPVNKAKTKFDDLALSIGK